MADEDDHYIASLFRGDEVQPYAFEVLRAKSRDEAVGLANEWAMTTMAAGGISVPTTLHLKHGAKGEFLRKWNEV